MEAPILRQRIGIAIIALLGWAGPVLGQGGPGQNAPAPTVTVAPVVVKDVAPAAEYIGRVQAIQSVDLRARVEGFLEKVAFKEGQDVKQGELLFQIEQAPYQAALDSAKAQVEKAQAALKQASDEYQRQLDLAKKGFQTQSVLDQARATRDADAADVATAQANIETAQLNLNYTTITSPIDGRIGKATYTQGNLVGPSSNPLATVVELNPIRVVFSVADRDLVSEKQKTGNNQQQINAQFVPTLRLSNGTEFPEKGEIEFVDNVVDPTTGTVAVWARFPNVQKLLLPGQFVNVMIRPEQPQRLPVVPQVAVQEDKNGKFVLVVGEDEKAQERRITATRQVGQDWIVDDGLHAGETVIVDGVQKVRPGMVVHAVPQTPPQAQQGQPQQGQQAQDGGPAAAQPPAGR